MVKMLFTPSAKSIAESSDATADVEITRGVPVTYNDPDLTAMMLPSVQAAAGNKNVHLVNAKTGAEDFSFYALKAPALFLFLGGMPADMNPQDAAPHHTPDFFIDDSGMKLGVKTLAYLTVDYIRKNSK